jgi:hypothetical protein
LKDRNQLDGESALPPKGAVTPSSHHAHPILSAASNHKKVIATIKHSVHRLPLNVPITNSGNKEGDERSASKPAVEEIKGRKYGALEPLIPPKARK